MKYDLKAEMAYFTEQRCKDSGTVDLRNGEMVPLEDNVRGLEKAQAKLLKEIKILMNS